jgi:DNA invertase Pin-like site-specific DNA recombinase
MQEEAHQIFCIGLGCVRDQQINTSSEAGRLNAIKESIHFEGKQDLQTRVMVALFGLFAEVERDLISERTREGLASARAKGRLLGRPKGVLGKSRLDGKEEEIRLLL